MQSIFYIATAALAASIAYAQDGSGEGANNSTVPTAQEGNRTIHYVDVALGGHYYIVRHLPTPTQQIFADFAHSPTAFKRK